MKAIVKPSADPGLVVRDVAEPACGPADVLIRVRHAGVCGTDLHIADWDEWARSRIKPPLVVGHEFAGEIAEVGSEVRDQFRPGQSVTAEGHIACGHCLQCRTGNGHICKKTEIIGVDRDGAFADLIAMPATNVMPLDGIPTEIGAVMDPMGNAFHTVLSAEVAGGVVLILGCGPIGCFAVGIARAAGARAVVAADVNPRRLSLATTMGATRALHATSDDVEAAVMELSDGNGADVVCEMSGAAAAIRSAFRLVRNGGRVQLLGLPHGEVPMNLATDVIFKGITIYGVIGRKMYETWNQMQRFLKSGQFDPRPVITHRFPLSKIDDALAAIRSGDAGKVILEIGS
jgi:threonine 3-dehydrogenase